MLDAEPPIVRAPERRRVGFEHRPIRAIPDRMRVDLKPMGDRFARHALNIGFLQNQKPGRARIVRIRREQRGPARAERAIGDQFDAAHREAIAGLGTPRQVLPPQRAFAADHRVHPDRKPMRRDELPVSVEILGRDSGVMHRGESHSRALLGGARDPFRDLSGSRRRNMARHKLLRAIYQHAARHALVRPQDLPSRRIFGSRAHVAGIERFLIHPRGVPVDPRQIDRILWRGGGEQVAARELP